MVQARAKHQVGVMASLPLPTAVGSVIVMLPFGHSHHLRGMRSNARYHGQFPWATIRNSVPQTDTGVAHGPGIDSSAANHGEQMALVS